MIFGQLYGQEFSVENPKSDFLFDIEEWRYDNLSDIEAKFNLARDHEHIETNIDLPTFKFPGDWEKYSVVKKVKWLADKERKDRNQKGLEEINKNLSKIAEQASKDQIKNYHQISGSGKGVSVILKNDSFIDKDAEYTELLRNNEELVNNQIFTFINDVKDIPVLEMIFFNWIYADSDNEWKYRNFILNTKFKENGGDSYSEGFIGASLLDIPVIGEKDTHYILAVQFYDPGNNWNYGVKSPINESLEFSVYTTEGILNLTINEASDSLKVEVYNLLGQQVIDKKVDRGVNNAFTIDGPKGYYLVKVSANRKSKTVKVLIP
ncbi:MAG: T9SS type A sorting domain-containing protein [Bacteroidota bacterium]